MLVMRLSQLHCIASAKPSMKIITTQPEYLYIQCANASMVALQDDFLKGEEGKSQSEQRALPRPPPQMRQALPTAPQAVADFNDSMAAYYHQVQ